ncbi:hypothetical protein NSS71_19250 [Niallia sp. FSL W8-0951]|uniref:hypothetical protein n=1 Tax=Niallia sp. FSL W8-0951 TaxID=2954639 RepID=UPI0030F9038D
MSKKGSNKEAIFAIYLKDQYKGRKELLDFELSNIVLEQRHANNNIDLSAVSIIRKLGIYMEIQLTKANKKYLGRIKSMMIRYPESVIIWVARSFDISLLEDLDDWMLKHNKQYIDFYALTISEEAMKKLHSLNQLYKLDVYNKMDVLNDISNLLHVEYKLKNLHPTHCGGVAIEPPTYDFSRPDDIKKALLEVLKKRMPYFLNFHYRKKANLYDHVLTIGSGRSNISYRCSAKNAKSLAFVELYFDSSREKEYDEFKKVEQTIRQKVHPHICFENRRIGVYFQPLQTYEETFEQIAEIFERFIQFFSPYFYGRNDIKVIREQEENSTETIQSAILTRLDYSSNRLIEDFMKEETFETEESYRIRQEEVADYFIYRY